MVLQSSHTDRSLKRDVPQLSIFLSSSSEWFLCSLHMARKENLSFKYFLRKVNGFYHISSLLTEQIPGCASSEVSGGGFFLCSCSWKNLDPSNGCRNTFLLIYIEVSKLIIKGTIKLGVFSLYSKHHISSRLVEKLDV